MTYLLRNEIMKLSGLLEVAESERDKLKAELLEHKERAESEKVKAVSASWPWLRERLGTLESENGKIKAELETLRATSPDLLAQNQTLVGTAPKSSITLDLPPGSTVTINLAEAQQV